MSRFQHGEGAHLQDVEARDCVDYMLRRGQSFLQHAHPRIHSAAMKATSADNLLVSTHSADARRQLL